MTDYETYQLRRCTPRDGVHLLALQGEILRSLDAPELMEGSSRAEFADYLGGNGKVFAVEAADELVGYGIFAPLATADARLRTLGAEVAAAHSIAESAVGVLDTVAVHPEHRGHSLQGRLCDAIHDCSRANGHALVMTTVSPQNTVSLKNFEKMGYERHCDAILYGKARTVLALRL